MGKLNKWFKRHMGAIALATASVEKNALGQEYIDLSNDTGNYQRHNQGTLADSLINGEITEEVQDLRWRMMKVLEASEGYIISSLGIDEDGYHTMDVEIPDAIGQKVLLRKIKLDEFDDYKLELSVDNKPITLGGVEAMESDSIEEYKSKKRTESIKENEDGSVQATLGEIGNEAYHSNIKNENPVKVVRTDRPRFEIEKYTKKLNVRTISGKEKLLEFYISMYPDEYDRKTRLLITEIKKAIINPRVFNMLDIEGVGFTTYKTAGAKDFHQYQYEITGFDKIVEFNGHYVIKFKAEVMVNGEYLLEKFRRKELDKKYENKEAKD